jgi:GNAT superfamily N-acetyltransferase
MVTKIKESHNLQEISNLMNQMHEFSTPFDIAELKERLHGKKKLMLVAYHKDLPIGFKLGYDRYSDGSFYSWLGGVLPNFRRSGVATALLNAMETWMQDNGYHTLRFKTRNFHRAMLQFAVKQGFQVSGFKLREPIEQSRIELLKHLV